MFLPGGLAETGKACSNSCVRRQCAGENQQNKPHCKGKGCQRHQRVALLPQLLQLCDARIHASGYKPVAMPCRGAKPRRCMG
ncbi:hypothetical protein ROS1_37330 [Roseibium sp. ROS1]